MDTSILSGIRVIDFTRVLAGPFATRCLADFGAEVIKIQSKKTALGAESNTGGYFNTWNRNKRSILLDMSFPEARDIVLELAAVSDVVIENFAPRVMRNWGLGYKTLKTVKDDLIMLSMSGMGRSGPWKDYVAFGPTVQSLGGLSYLTSYSSDSPQGMGYSYADPSAGLYGALAVLAALEFRDRTGTGQYIDLSEYEVVSTLIGPALMDALANDRDAVPRGNRSDNIFASPYGCYPCRGDDEWCVIAVYEEIQWQALCRVMGRPEWGRADRFATVSKRKAHTRELDDVIGGWTSRHRAEEVVEMLQAEGVPAGVVQDARDLANDPQLRERGFFVSLKHPVLGDTVSDRSPVRFQKDATAGWKAAPLLGQDNQYVYTELLGFSEDRLFSYIEQGIIG